MEINQEYNNSILSSLAEELGYLLIGIISYFKFMPKEQEHKEMKKVLNIPFIYFF